MATNADYWIGNHTFHKNDIYTISYCRLPYPGDDKEMLYLVLEEVNILNIQDNKTIAWGSSAFRPIKKTSIDIFTKMLNNIPVVETI